MGGCGCVWVWICVCVCVCMRALCVLYVCVCVCMCVCVWGGGVVVVVAGGGNDGVDWGLVQSLLMRHSGSGVMFESRSIAQCAAFSSTLSRSDVPGGARQHFSDLHEYTMNPRSYATGGAKSKERVMRDRREGEKHKDERRGERGDLGERKKRSHQKNRVYKKL